MKINREYRIELKTKKKINKFFNLFIFHSKKRFYEDDYKMQSDGGQWFSHFLGTIVLTIFRNSPRIFGSH